MRKTNLKKIWLRTVIVLAAVAIAANLAAWILERNDAASQIEFGCENGSGDLAVWPESLSEFTDKSYGVVVGNMINTDASPRLINGYPTSQFRVTEVLKGHVLHKGAVLQLCETGPTKFVDGNHAALIFLAGQNRGVWIPLQGEIGIIPQSKNGRFQRDWADDSKTSATVDELKQLIN